MLRSPPFPVLGNCGAAETVACAGLGSVDCRDGPGPTPVFGAPGTGRTGAAWLTEAGRAAVAAGRLGAAAAAPLGAAAEAPPPLAGRFTQAVYMPEAGAAVPWCTLIE